MDRAYHLQYPAHRAVNLALQAGRLVRQPCETCGADGQAHHDSYHPDRWLDVRWLCRVHHREWHQANEPDWPSIYDYHPSDADAYWPVATAVGGFARGKSGRPPRPWFRTGRGKWCVMVNGRQYDLGPDYEQAMSRFRAIRDGTESGTE